MVDVSIRGILDGFLKHEFYSEGAADEVADVLDAVTNFPHVVVHYRQFGYWKVDQVGLPSQHSGTNVHIDEAVARRERERVELKPIPQEPTKEDWIKALELHRLGPITQGNFFRAACSCGVVLEPQETDEELYQAWIGHVAIFPRFLRHERRQ